ncbi:topoisomerase C-terminal repeat-containing protein, partial [Ralstonia pseudosolanacearum]
LVDDDALREAMAGKGLGTPATRAAIIEGLLTEKYLLREGRELIPTAKAFQLMTLLRGLGVEELTQAELTGEWEHKLAQIERGRLARDEFMREIAQMTQQIVKRAKEYDSDTIPGDYATLSTPCPQCGHVVKENYRRFACSHCDFSISKIPGGRQFELEEVEELLINKTIGPLQGFRSKMGRPFAAILKLAQEDGHWKMEFDFGQNDGDEDGEPVDFSGQESVGHCPKCSGSVYEHGLKYVCENAVAQPKTCDFTTGKIILQQEISREQLHKLLAEGKTDLLTGFKSARTGRVFKAFLVKQPDGKIGFEFEPRGEGKAAAKKTTTAAKKTAAAKAPAKTAAKKTTAAAKKTPARKKAATEADEESTSET